MWLVRVRMVVLNLDNGNSWCFECRAACRRSDWGRSLQQSVVFPFLERCVGDAHGLVVELSA